MDRPERLSGELTAAVTRAAALIAEADALIVAAGAGIGVDSGLPDFRGPQGFWRAYPALGRRRLSFEEIAHPRNFAEDPALAWGFYGHRLALYRATVPHEGFGVLRRLGEARPKGYFVFTSNVDGQFQKALFDPRRIVEIHGSIHHLQCRHGCAEAIWPADDFLPEVDAEQCHLRNAAPRCPHCGAVARPNILMFGDGGWLARRTRGQLVAFDAWRRSAGRVVTLELGAGSHVPTVRYFAEDEAGPLIRINPDAPDLPAGKPGVALPMGALAASRALAAAAGMAP